MSHASPTFPPSVSFSLPSTVGYDFEHITYHGDGGYRDIQKVPAPPPPPPPPPPPKNTYQVSIVKTLADRAQLAVAVTRVWFQNTTTTTTTAAAAAAAAAALLVCFHGHHHSGPCVDRRTED